MKDNHSYNILDFDINILLHNIYNYLLYIHIYTYFLIDLMKYFHCHSFYHLFFLRNIYILSIICFLEKKIRISHINIILNNK